MSKKEEQCEDKSQQTFMHLIQPQRKYDSKHPKQMSVTNALVNFVADDLIPLSIVDTTQFKTLLGTLDSQYQLPSRKYLSTVLLKKQYDSLKGRILDQLSKIETINLTAD